MEPESRAILGLGGVSLLIVAGVMLMRPFRESSGAADRAYDSHGRESTPEGTRGGSEETKQAVISSFSLAGQAPARCEESKSLPENRLADTGQAGPDLDLLEESLREVGDGFAGTQEEYANQALKTWPSVVGVEWLAGRFDITSEEAARVLDLVVTVSEPYNRMLADGAAEYGQLMHSELTQRLRSRDVGVSRDPVVAEERARPQDVFFSKVAIAKGGATVWVDLSESGSPTLAALRRQMRFLIQQRDERIRALLDDR